MKTSESLRQALALGQTASGAVFYEYEVDRDRESVVGETGRFVVTTGRHGEKRILEVDVTRRVHYGGTPIVEVSWSALGGVDGSTAGLYAAMLLVAVRTAVALKGGATFLEAAVATGLAPSEHHVAMEEKRRKYYEEHPGGD